MPAKKKTTKKPAKKPTPKNPTDPNLLGRSVMEAFLGETVTPKKKKKSKLTKKR